MNPDISTFQTEEFYTQATNLISFIYNIDTDEVSDFSSLNRKQHYKSLSVFDFLAQSDKKNIKDLLQWVENTYENKKYHIVKISFSVLKVSDSVEPSIILMNIFKKTDSKRLFKFVLTELLGCDNIISSKIIVSSQNNLNGFKTDFVLSDFNGKIVLKNQEYDIMRFLTQGLTTDEIGVILNLSSHTVNSYRKSLAKIFDAKNMYQLIRNAKKNNFI